jgi:hypothetical protein
MMIFHGSIRVGEILDDLLVLEEKLKSYIFGQAGNARATFSNNGRIFWMASSKSNEGPSIAVMTVLVASKIINLSFFVCSHERNIQERERKATRHLPISNTLPFVETVGRLQIGISGSCDGTSNRNRG